MATIPVPLDPSSAAQLTVPVWDAGVRDPLNFLLSGWPRCHVWDSTGTQSFANNGALQLVTFDSETYDTDTMHSTISSTSRITATTAGLYEFDAMFSFPEVAFTSATINVRLNANGVATGGSSLRTQSYGAGGVSPMFRFNRLMNAGDYIEYFLQQTSGAARVLSGTSLGTRVFAKMWSTS